jgi:hypothetical protein
VTAEASVLRSSLGPRLLEGDGAAHVLGDLLTVIGGELDTLATIVRDRPGYPGWSVVGDIERSPSVAWLLQWVGVQYRTGLSEEENRARGRDRPESRRGTPAHLKAVAAEYLSGASRVELYERWGGLSTHVLLRVYAAELIGGDPTEMTKALLRTVPWPLKLTVQVVVGWSYAQAGAADATYAAALTHFPSYASTTYHQP